MYSVKCFKKDISEERWYALFRDENIMKEATRYLKHKTHESCSPYTVRQIAYSLSYYYTYLEEVDLSMESILQMKYSEQHDHFCGFLYWIKNGSHNGKRIKFPSNASCNSYLEKVFGFYSFLTMEYGDQIGTIKIWENRSISYSSSVGIRQSRNIRTFRGYLKEEKVLKPRSISEENIKIILEATKNLRNKLIILLLAETGFRIGELLGVRYAEDIDFEKHIIRVVYRQDNPNNARAKNAEYRHAVISDETFQILMYYISENRRIMKDSPYLFVNFQGINKGKALSLNAVYSAMRLLEKKTNIPITPHKLRHYYANARRKDGWKMEMISRALGHRKLSTTEAYLQVEDDEMSKVMEEYYKKHNDLYNIGKLL